MIFEVHDERYQRKAPESAPTNPKRWYHFRLFGISLRGEDTTAQTGPPSPLEAALLSEYGLVSRKSSRLSRGKRDMVVNEFNRRFERLESKAS